MRLRVLGIVLAGGKGTRLYPLTKERAKPAVPFGGKYRIVDFVLSNFINSGIYSIYVLTQFKSQSLLQHLSDGWQFGGLLKDQFVIPVPGHPERVFASMGNYVFSTRTLMRVLYDDARLDNSSHDFGRDILPSLVRRVEMFAFDFQTNQIPGETPGTAAYWRDVGTLEAYY